MMDGLEEFMLFNACEDISEEAKREGSTGYPYCNQFGDNNVKKTSYWDDEKPSSNDDC